MLCMNTMCCAPGSYTRTRFQLRYLSMLMVGFLTATVRNAAHDCLCCEPGERIRRAQLSGYLRYLRDLYCSRRDKVCTYACAVEEILS